MKITSYDQEFHLDLSGSGGVVAGSFSSRAIALGSNTPLVESGLGSPGSGPQPAAWDHVHPAYGSSSAFGSNSTRVASVSAAGASSSNSRADHVHDGIGTVTASGSNTLNRGTFNLRAGTGIALALSNTDGGSGLDTVTIQNIAASGGGGGGGSITDYVSGASGSGQIVIPGIIADRRRLPSSPSGSDTEFATQGLGTLLGTLDTDNVSDKLSHWHAVKAMPNSVVTHGRYMAAPSMPFTATTLVTGGRANTDFQGFGLLLTESAPGKCASFHVIGNGGALTPAMYRFNTNTSFASSVNGTNASAVIGNYPIWLRITVASSTSVTFEYSPNGDIWYPGVTAQNPSLTVANVGLCLTTAGGSVTCEAFFDFLRFT